MADSEITKTNCYRFRARKLAQAVTDRCRDSKITVYLPTGGWFVFGGPVGGMSVSGGGGGGGLVFGGGVPAIKKKRVSVNSLMTPGDGHKI